MQAVELFFQNSKDEESESDVWSDLNLMRSKYTMICKLLKLETVDTKAKEISSPDSDSNDTVS